jgi:hypothetical protein
MTATMARRLTTAVVVRLRDRASHGVPISVLAREVGLSRIATRKAIYGLTYREVPGALPPRSGDAHPSRKLTDFQVRSLRHRRAQGAWTLQDLALAFGISISTVAACLNYETYANVE